ncbi:MAG: DUF4340 domain-containing protein [Rhizomicrobium sp.]|nr:DUF4340 domain-containing protein [Rhizomicrobium sp.]
MSLREFFYTSRNRNLAALTAVAAVTVLLAFLALHHREAMVAPKYSANIFLPGLSQALNAGDVTHIRIASKSGAFNIAFLPAKGWVLTDRSNYPASFEVVKQTLVTLAALETIEPKTDSPELYRYIGLDAPPSGAGVAVTLRGDKGKVLADIILGKAVPRGDDAIGLFVRKAGDKQSWLVRSPAELKTNAADWMDKNVVAIDRARIASITVEPASGPAYTIKRATLKDESFSVAPLPKGRELSYAGAGDSAATTLSDFAFDDIKPAMAVDFSGAAHMIVRSFDGVTVSLDIATVGTEHWVRLMASGEPGAAAKEALAINTHASAWAFKLPPYKASLFAAPLESLLKPKAK